MARLVMLVGLVYVPVQVYRSWNRPPRAARYQPLQLEISGYYSGVSGSQVFVVVDLPELPYRKALPCQGASGNYRCQVAIQTASRARRVQAWLACQGKRCSPTQQMTLNSRNQRVDLPELRFQP